MFASMERTLSYEFVQLDQQFSAVFSGDQELPALNRILDLVGAATLQFGLCELFDRRGQRMAAIKDDRSIQFYRMRDQYHQKGIQLLASATKDTNDLVSQYAAIKKWPRAALARTTVQGFHEEVMRLITDSELKPGDISKIEKVFAEVDDIVLSRRKDFAIYITDKLKELESVRSRPDRGNVDNIPMWKVVVIAAYLAVAVWYVYRCLLLGWCSNWEKASYYLAAVVLGITLKFC